ncbi:MAG: DUF1857 family protein [Azoarcus sp.]|nr:DUF1857 family protein [Azoarcus sp.]
MQFEHLVEVNEANGAALSREELWFGLLCRAEDARRFLPGLDECRIVERHENELVRELRFGSALVRDRVRLNALESIVFDIEANDEHVGGSLSIAIEEDDAGALFLRFRYLTSLPEASAEDAGYADVVRSAYYQSDLDTLRVIRQIARLGHMQ